MGNGSAGPPPRWDTLVALRPAGIRAPLYCLPAGGGSANAYRQLAARLPAGRPVLGFECPGLDDDRPPAGSIHELAEEFSGYLLEQSPEVACHLLGWSMGGAVAFETAVRVAAAGRRVGMLVLIDPPIVRAGSMPRQMPAESAVARQFLQDLLGGASGTSQLMGELAQLATPGDLSRMFDAMQAAGLVDADLDEFLTVRYAVFRANVQALVNYTPSGRYPGPAALIRADQSPPTAADWRALVDSLRLSELATRHDSILTGEAVVAVAGLVDDMLREFE